jgi:hypothetical protein
MREELDIPMPHMGPGYRVPRHRAGMDSNTKRLALIAAGIGGALVVLVGAWSMTGHRRSGVPVVEADSRPLRVKPENPGGLQVAGSDEAIMSGKSDDTAALAPPPEAPAPQALKAQEAQAAAAAAAAAAVRASAAAAPPAAQPVSLSPAAPAPSSTAALVTPLPDTKPLPPKAAPVPKAAPAPAASAPATAPAAPTARGAQVQLAALMSEQAAMTEWQRLEKKMPDMLGGRKPAVMKIERDGKTFWRLRTGGFADAAEATSFCARVKAKGASCAVAAL